MKVSAVETPASAPAAFKEKSSNAASSRYIAKAPMELQIPVAHAWTTGMLIRDDQGEVLFRVAKEFNLGTDMKPQYVVVLMDPEESSILSLIKSRIGGYVGSCYEGQPVGKSTDDKPGWFGFTAPWRDCVQEGAQSLYLHGKLFLKKYSGPKKKDTVFHYKPAVGDSGVIEYTEPKTGIVKLTRDQSKQTISVAAGGNILEAVSLAYAIDRRYKVLGSTMEMNARPKDSMEWSAKLGHLSALRRMGASTKEDVNAATGNVGGEAAAGMAGSLAGSLLGSL